MDLRNWAKARKRVGGIVFYGINPVAIHKIVITEKFYLIYHDHKLICHEIYLVDKECSPIGLKPK